MSSTYGYLPISDEVMQHPIYITGVGMADVKPREQYPQRRHPSLYQFSWEQGRILPEYQLLYIKSGAGIFESEKTGVIRVGAGTIVVLFPSVWHRYKPDAKTGWVENWISMNGRLIHQMEDVGMIRENDPVVQIERVDRIANIYSLLIKEIENISEEYSIEMFSVAMQLLGYISEELNTDSKARVYKEEIPNRTDNDIHVRSATRYIWNHSHHQISVEDVADQLPISRRTLERHFKEYTGYSIHDELKKCRLSRALRLLRETNMPIKQIAYIVGFSNLVHMDRAFKLSYGVTPSDYRKQALLGNKVDCCVLRKG
ncbi:AraC family transcriptional regulator [Planctomycetota bacterium]|nr:AraC family transcriptional regulator [Planctomycetota bacterium]